MKIIHPSGESYDIDPGTNLEMSRTNPFFNEYGEQSLPITLPPTAKNRRLTAFADDPAAVAKHSNRIDAVIQEGIFHIKSRQAILSANRKEGIKTSFYINEGAFFERLKDIQLSEIFKNKVLTFPSVDSAIHFVHTLMINYDQRFACFSVMANNEEGNGYVYINKIDHSREYNGCYNFYNDITRTETVGENKITIPPGYYISPFIRVKYLLQEIFSFIGYTLINDTFLTLDEPFRSMVLLNNNIDTIVRKEIRFSQLVPDCMASTILNLFRNKFCCEFIPEETTRTVSIVVFDSVLQAKPERDISPTAVSYFDINYPATFRQLKLSAEKTEAKENNISLTNIRGTKEQYSSDQFDSLKDILNKYPDAELDQVDGRLFRIGFRGVVKIIEYLGSINCNYYAGGTLKIEEKTSPDIFIEMRYSPERKDEYGNIHPWFMYPYIESARALNSSVLIDGATGNTNTEKDVDKSKTENELKPVLCFVSHDAARKCDIGTIYNYDYNRVKLWNYTLSYNGEEGLYEKFWRKYDTLLRNSFIDISVDQILSEADKLSLSSYKKVVIRNQELLPNIFKYMPGKRVSTECTYLTTKLYEPVSEAMSESARIKPSEYYWAVESSLSRPDMLFADLKEQPAIAYYPQPTKEQYDKGDKYYWKAFPALLYKGFPMKDPVDGYLYVWVVAKKK